MDFFSSFSERLSDLMSDAALNSRQLAEKIGVDASSVWLWKAGKVILSLSNAIALADFFHCSLEFLFGRSDTLLDFTPKPALSFYNQLKSVMKAKGISRYRICVDLKKGHGHFDNWKAGGDPHISTVLELANYLGVTLDFLAGRER